LAVPALLRVCLRVVIAVGVAILHVAEDGLLFIGLAVMRLPIWYQQLRTFGPIPKGKGSYKWIGD